MKRRQKDFNRNHPELRKGEVFITNISLESQPQICPDFGCQADNRSDWECVGWKTKRMGNVAHDIYGTPLTGLGMRPVFAQRAELQKAGLDPDKL